MPEASSRRLHAAVAAGPLLAFAAAGVETAASGPQPPVPAPVFVDITASAGISFRHRPGSLDRFPLPGIMGAGAALFDADQDGDLDLYLIQSGALPEARAERGAAGAPTNRLFLRQPDGSFLDATATGGLGDAGYGLGVAVGDLDGDGDPDLVVTNYGPDRVYRNGGAGVFAEIPGALPAAIAPSPRSGDATAPGGRWSTSAALCDYDGDRDLDLYVAGYLVNDPDRDCVSASGEPDFCAPQSLPYERDALFRNRGDGRFEDVSEVAGIFDLRRPGLGVLCHDFTGDGRLDFYVANDGEPNTLWEQIPEGGFEDAALFLGAALNGQGRAEASMGVALGDADGDGRLDLFMTHLRSQSNTLYRSEGGAFTDATAAAGLGPPSLKWTGFGVRFLDLERDGDSDLVILNGAVARASGTPAAGGLAAYAEPAQILLNEGDGSYRETTAGDFSDLNIVGRGLVAGDWDRDGDLDLVVTSVGGPVRLFENRSPTAGGFLVVEPREYGRSAPGAVVILDLAGGRSLVRPLNPEAGYLTSSEPIVHFGIPPGERPAALRVRWPDGSETRHPAPAPNTRVTLARPDGVNAAARRRR